jgi:hypothetical protein
MPFDAETIHEQVMLKRGFGERHKDEQQKNDQGLLQGESKGCSVKHIVGRHGRAMAVCQIDGVTITPTMFDLPTR